MGDEFRENLFPLIVRPQVKNRLSERRSRILEQNGHLNVFDTHIPDKKYRYVKDLGNTLISTRWRWILLSLCIANSIAWVLYGLLWMAVATLNRDYEKSVDDPNACIVGTRNFTGYLLLSVETLTTIGFGAIYPTNCKEGWLVLTLQALTGVFIEGALVTAVFVKMSRPRKYANGLFSSRAIVCMRNGHFCLVFRVYDELGKYWARTQIKAFVVLLMDEGKRSRESERLSNYMQKLELQSAELLMGPTDVVHVITNCSPLWHFGADDFLKRRFEIILVVGGDSSTTGQPSECWKSFTNREIHWGHRFQSCLEYDETKEAYVVRLDRFNSTSMCETPLCSPSRYMQIVREIKENTRRRSI